MSTIWTATSSGNTISIRTCSGAPINVGLLHQVVTSQLVNRRQGNADTKTRAEVSGGNKKPYRQKGTGRARQGSTRAPQFRGGGVVFGPQPHAYERNSPAQDEAQRHPRRALGQGRQRQHPADG